MMISKKVVVAVGSVCLLMSQAVMASPVRVSVPVQANLMGTRNVKMNLRNDSKTTLKIKVGASQMSVEPGKTVTLSAPAGTKIVVDEATGNHAAGDVLGELNKDFADSTLRIS